MDGCATTGGRRIRAIRLTPPTEHTLKWGRKNQPSIINQVRTMRARDEHVLFVKYRARMLEEAVRLDTVSMCIAGSHHRSQFLRRSHIFQQPIHNPSSYNLFVPQQPETMARKKTTYEKKGIVRQLAGSIFASNKDRSQDAKWRPRNTQFERLDGDDEGSDINNAINRAFSIESETHDYKREILLEKKKAVFEQSRSKKRDLSSITIKPSARDRGSARTNATRIKKVRKDHLNSFIDPFGTNFHESSNQAMLGDESVDESLSRHTSCTRHTASTTNTAFHTVHSDPSDFFSKQPAKLTKGNLEMMASMERGDGIENVNPRSKFHQFTIEEDKESTVILPVGHPGDTSVIDSDDEELLEEDSLYSSGYTSKGTKIQKPRLGQQRAFAKKMTTEQKKEVHESLSKSARNDRFERAAFFPEFDDTAKADPFFGAFPSDQEPASPQTRNVLNKKRDPSQQFQSTHSLAYSESSCEETSERAGFENTPEGTIDVGRFGKVAQDIRSMRTPLSPLIVRSTFNSSKAESSLRTGFDFTQSKPDPDAAWSSFPNIFERKPDPKGIDFSLSKHNEEQDNLWTSPGKERAVESQAFVNSINSTVVNRRRDFVTDAQGTMSKENTVNQPIFDPFVRSDEEPSISTGLASAKAGTKHSQIPDMWGMRVIHEGNKPIEGEDEDDDIDDFDPEYEYGFTKRQVSAGKPVGIQSFSNQNLSRSYSSSSSHNSGSNRRSNSAHSRSHDSSLGRSDQAESMDNRFKFRYGYSGDQNSQGSQSRSYQDRALCSHGLPKSRCCHVEDRPGDDESLGRHSTSSASFTKPFGLPNNAIMASMLFRRHHNIDTQIVDAKLKAREQEYKTDRKRGDIPQTVQAVDGYSSVSSFSEDTAAQIDAWRKPTRDLLEHFARSRKVEYDAKKRIEEQRDQATALFEA